MSVDSTLVAKVVVQINPATNERNVQFVTDPDINLEDVVVSAPNWKNSQTYSGEIILVGDQRIIDLLSDVELRGSLSIPSAFAELFTKGDNS